MNILHVLNWFLVWLFFEERSRGIVITVSSVSSSLSACKNFKFGYNSKRLASAGFALMAHKNNNQP